MRLPGAAVSMITIGTTITPQATAGSVACRRQKSGPSRAAANAARVNIVNWAGRVQ
jgi:hypothetical protein